LQGNTKTRENAMNFAWIISKVVTYFVIGLVSFKCFDSWQLS